MTVTGFAHVGILVEDLGPVEALFREHLGLSVDGPEHDRDLGLAILWVRAGATVLEFVAPSRPDSRAAAALTRGEGGVHHVALAVDGLDAMLARLQSEGVPTRAGDPRQGAHGSRVAFLEPDAVGGTLVELVEGGDG